MDIGPGQVQLRGSLTIAACRTSKVGQELKEREFQERSIIYSFHLCPYVDLSAVWTQVLGSVSFGIAAEK